jgi:hypothetical protein
MRQDDWSAFPDSLSFTWDERAADSRVDPKDRKKAGRDDSDAHADGVSAVRHGHL